MTNLDKIRAMSAEELVLRYQSRRPCEVCSYFEDNECSLKGYAGKRECNGGRIKWLNQVDNPMPKIQIGDCILTHINKSLVMLVVLSDIYASNLHGVMVKWRELKDILKIKRINDENGCVEVIWRADDEKL